MDSDSLVLAEKLLVEEYVHLTPRSRAVFDRYAAVVPDGPHRTEGLAPYPAYITGSDGAEIYDADGRTLVDFVCSNMGGILGHNNLVVRERLHQQLDRGLFTLTPATEGELAQLLADRIPSVERVRFTPTGTEATMFALRCARAFTGRHRIAKTDGGYHGSHDLVWIGQWRHHLQGAGQLAPGISPSVANDVTVLPFNHLDASRALLEQNAHELAAIIVEPILGGAGPVPATLDYLRMLRHVADKHSIILIFDEMISLGVGSGGAQEMFGVVPDMTTAGKTIAVGLPMAFYGGRAEIMDMTAFGESRRAPRVLHVGTYGSHPLALEAGLAAISQQGPDLFAHLHSLGEYMRSRLRKYAADRQIPLQVSGLAHLWGCHWVEEPVTDYETMLRANLELATQLQTAMFDRGIFTAFRRGIVSAAHTRDHVDRFVDALDDALIMLGRVV